MKYSIRKAVACWLGENVKDLERERRYQPTCTPCPVYSCNNIYLTACRIGKRPKNSNDTRFGYWNWNKALHQDSYNTTAGYEVWVHDE